MTTASEIIGEAGIRLRRDNDGNHKTTCPQCSHTRKNRRDPCLSVGIDRQGVRWHCHNCGWSGGKFYDAPRARPEGRDGARRAWTQPGNRRSLRDLYR